MYVCICMYMYEHMRSVLDYKYRYLKFENIGIAMQYLEKYDENSFENYIDAMGG